MQTWRMSPPPPHRRYHHHRIVIVIIIVVLVVLGIHCEVVTIRQIEADNINSKTEKVVEGKVWRV